MKQTLVEDIKQGPKKRKNGPLTKRRREEEESDKVFKTRQERERDRFVCCRFGH